MTRRMERAARNLQRYIARIVDEELNLPAMSSVTRVTCDSGLTKARVFVSIYGDDAKCRETLEELVEKSWIVRRELSRRAQMKRTPELIFVSDTSLQDGQEMIDLIDRLSLSR